MNYHFYPLRPNFCNQLHIQSNLVIMSLVGSEVKWHSNENLQNGCRIVVCCIIHNVLYTINETMNDSNKIINGFSIIACHLFSQVCLTVPKTLNNR